MDGIFQLGTKFWLRNDYKPVVENVYKYKYELKFEATEMLFQDIQYFYLNQGGIEAEWSLMNNAGNFLQIAVDDINRYFKTTKFVIGIIEADNTSINIKFNPNTTVFAALKQIADAFDCEWYLSGYTLHFVKKLSFGDEIEFENEVSVLSMDRSEGENTFRYNRILALGSTRNIPANYRATEDGEAVDVIYQKRLRIPKEKGNMIDVIPNLSPEEAIEGVVIFDDVYPKRIGTIEAIETIPYTDTNEETGVVTKWFAYKFKDSGLLFKEDYLLPGIELKLTFQSGKLNGKTFSLFFHPNGFSKTDNSQCFEIARNEDYGRPLPNDIIKPEPGDEYVLWGVNIALVGDQYVPAGEQELYETVQKWIEKELRDKSVYECPTVIDYFTQNESDLEVGQKVRLIKSVGCNRNYWLNSKEFKGGSSTSGISIINIDGNKGVRSTIPNNNWLSIAGALFSEIFPNTDYVFSVDIKYVGEKPLPPTFYTAKTGYKPLVGNLLNNQWVRVYQHFNSGETTRLNTHFGFSGREGDYYFRNFKLEKGTSPTEWSPAPEDIKDGVRSSRIMGFEKKLINKYDATYIVGDNAVASRWADVEDSIKTLEIGGQLFEKSGSGNVYLLKTIDNTPPTEHNAYSAKASDHRYLNRRTGGTVDGHTYFREGIKVQGEAISDSFGNSTFTAGAFGSGFRTWVDKQSGLSYAEFDHILARRGFDVVKLNIAEIDSIEGQILLSLANMFVTKVEEALDSFVCYFENDNGKIPNKFALDDQVICRSFEGGNIKYYWTRVVGIGTDYIRISKADKDGNVVPAYGDNIIQFGNRTNLNRQHAILLSAYGSDAPSIKQYSGINSYDLTGKEKTVISPKGNKFTGTFIIEASGKDIVSFVDESIDNIKIGGRNLLTNLEINWEKGYWNPSNGVKTGDGTTSLNHVRTKENIKIFVDKSTEYIIHGKKRIVALQYREDNSYIGRAVDNKDGSAISFITHADVDYLRFYALNVSENNDVDLLPTYEFQLEKGNKATDWTSAPEDTQAAINSKVAYTEYNSKMQVLENEISAKVGQTAFDELGERVSDSESSIEILSESITSTVQKVESIKIGAKNLAIGYGISKTQEGEYYEISLESPLIKDTEYTVSFDAKILTNKGYISVVPFGDFESGANAITGDWVYLKTSGDKRYSAVVKPTVNTKGVAIYPQNGYETATSFNAGKITFSKIAIYEGNKDIGYIEPTEEVDSRINSKNTIFQSDAEPNEPSGGFTIGDIWRRESLTDVNGNIDSDVTKNIFRLEKRWNGLEWIPVGINISSSYITQTADAIDLAVEDSINQVKAGIAINADGVTVFGEQFKVDTELIAKSISTKKLEVGEEGNPKFTVETDGTLKAIDGEFSGKISIADDKILLNKDGSGQLASGNIIWDSGGLISVNGGIQTPFTYLRIMNISGNYPISLTNGRYNYQVSIIAGNPIFILPTDSKYSGIIASFCNTSVGSVSVPILQDDGESLGNNGGQTLISVSKGNLLRLMAVPYNSKVKWYVITNVSM